MIPKITSHQMNNVLREANSKLDTIQQEIKSLKESMSQKIKIIRNEADYMEQQMKDIIAIKQESSKPTTDGEYKKVFIIPDNSISNEHLRFGSTITPKLKNTPTNVFNIITTATGQAFYRDIAEVAINNTVKDEYKNLLKHDTLNNKEFFYTELEGDNPNLTISIKLDTANTLGSALFNAIEFDTFLNGAYTINYIRVYEQKGDEYTEYASYSYAGKMRLILNKLHSLYKVDINITPTFSTEVNSIKKYPISIKHIYFYNTTFVTDSYVITSINSDKFINAISDDVKIKTPSGYITTTASKANIQFFLNYTIDLVTNKPILSSPQDPSKPNDRKEISMNTKTIYAKIPLNNESIIGYTFGISSKVQ